MASKTLSQKQTCMKFTKVAMQDPLGDIDRHGHLDLMMYKKLNKGAMQGTLGDIGRHGDSKLIFLQILHRGQCRVTVRLLG